MLHLRRLFVPTLALLLSNAPAAAAGDARDALRKAALALRSGDRESLETSLAAIIEAGGEKTMRSLLKMAIGASSERADLGVYWSVIQAAASFVDRAGLEELGGFILANRGRAISRDLVHALGSNRSRDVVVALAPVIEKGPEDLRLKAVLKLATVHCHEAVDVLVRVLEDEEKKSRSSPSDVMLAAADGLQRITGKDFGLSVLNWTGWWAKHKDEPLSLRPREDDTGRKTGTAADHLVSLRRRQFIGLEQAPKKGVVVLSAEFTKKVERDLNNDRMEKVLERMGIPHTVVRREDFLDFDLKETGAILVNCAQFHEFCICPTCKPGGSKENRLYKCTGCDKHDIFKPKLSPEAIEKLRKFVLSGGYLFSEDWIVKELVEQAFPNYVAAGEKLKEGAVEVLPIRGMTGHPYLEGIFVASPDERDESLSFDLADLDAIAEDDVDDDVDDDAGDDLGDPEDAAAGSGQGARGRTGVVHRRREGEEEPDEPAKLIAVRHKWTIDDESYRLEVRDASKVLALLGSGELMGAEGKGVVSIVALAFRPEKDGRAAEIGRGRAPPGSPGVVVQVLSHFGKQTSATDERSLENLLLNFLIDANVARERRSSR